VKGNGEQNLGRQKALISDFTRVKITGTEMVFLVCCVAQW